MTGQDNNNNKNLAAAPDEELSRDKLGLKEGSLHGEDITLDTVCNSQSSSSDNESQNAIKSSGGSRENHLDCSLTCNSNNFSIRVNGTFFTGARSSTENSLCCDLNGDEKVSTNAGETMKERNRRLLSKEREY